VATFDTNNPVTDNTQSIVASFRRLPDSAVKLISRARHRVDVLGETIRLSTSLRLAVEFLHVMYIKRKQMLVFNFIFDLLWTGRCFSVSSIAL
jgi:hypothetical protein